MYFMSYLISMLLSKCSWPSKKPCTSKTTKFRLAIQNFPREMCHTYIIIEELPVHVHGQVVIKVLLELAFNNVLSKKITYTCYTQPTLTLFTLWCITKTVPLL